MKMARVLRLIVPLVVIATVAVLATSMHGVLGEQVMGYRVVNATVVGNLEGSFDFAYGVYVFNTSSTGVVFAAYGPDYTPEPNKFSVYVYRANTLNATVETLAVFNEVVDGGFIPLSNPLPGKLLGLPGDTFIVAADHRPYGKPPSKSLALYAVSWIPGNESIVVERLGIINFSVPVSPSSIYPGPEPGTVIVYYTAFKEFRDWRDYTRAHGFLVYSIAERKVVYNATVWPEFIRKQDAFKIRLQDGREIDVYRFQQRLVPCYLAGHRALAVATGYEASTAGYINITLISTENWGVLRTQGMVVSNLFYVFLAQDPLSPYLIVHLIGGGKVDARVLKCSGKGLVKTYSNTLSIEYGRITVAAYRNTSLIVTQLRSNMTLYDTYGDSYPLGGHRGRYGVKVGGQGDTAILIAGAWGTRAVFKTAVLRFSLEPIPLGETTTTTTTTAPPSSTTTVTGTSTATTTATTPPETTTTTTGTPTGTTTTTGPTATSTQPTTTFTSPSTTKTSTTETTRTTKTSTTTSTPRPTTTSVPGIPLEPGDWLVYHVKAYAKGTKGEMSIEFRVRAEIAEKNGRLVVKLTPDKKLTMEEKKVLLAALGYGSQFLLGISSGVPEVKLEISTGPNKLCPLLIQPPGKPIVKDYSISYYGGSIKIKEKCKWTAKGVLERVEREMTFSSGSDWMKETVTITLVDASKDVGQSPAGITPVVPGGIPGGTTTLVILGVIIAVVIVAVIVVLARKR